MSTAADDAPSLYPPVSPAPPARPPPPPAPSTPPPAGAEPLPDAYELLLELPHATLSEDAAPAAALLPAPLTGTLRVIQGPAAADAYHAFLSLRDTNLPLLPTQPAARPAPHVFSLAIPGHAFTLRAPAADPARLDALQRLLAWFCRWHSAAAPAAPAGARRTTDRIAAAGDRGVRLVEAVGGRVNASITRRLSARVDRAPARPEPARALPATTPVAAKLLSGTRAVVGAGASAAALVIDGVSSGVGTVLAKNPVSKSLAAAPEGSSRRAFHDNLMAGMLAVGRVYVAADEQGKMIIAGAGDGSAEYARVRYGPGAEQAARSVAGIALDGYRIVRFPQKLGAAGLLKGALKANTKKETESGSAAAPPPSESDFGMSEGNFDSPHASHGQAPGMSMASSGPYREEAAAADPLRRDGFA